MAKSTAPVSGTNANGIDTSNWEKEQTGFAPYWEPGEGLSFLATPVAIDLRDPKFPRIQFVARETIECFTGSALQGKQESVMVQAGEIFNVSEYHALRDLLTGYLTFGAKTGIAIVCKVTALDKVPTKEVGKTVWRWDVRVSPEQKKLIAAFRLENPTVPAMNGGKARPQMEA